MDKKIVLDKFLRYVKCDSTAIDDAGKIPSSECQRDFANLLKDELLELGVEDAYVDENSFVFGTINPSEGYEDRPVIGLLAHLDTAPDCIGKGVKPIVHTNYNGEDLVVNEELGVIINTEKYPEIKGYVGDDIVTSDGTTLLGADDKGGIAIIMAVVEKIIKDTSIKHGKLKIGFTPDEEVSVGGASIFNVEEFGADLALTVDGDGLGELNFETFNAATCKVKTTGIAIHPAEAKDKMVNAISLGMEFDSKLPTKDRPEFTGDREGFYHLEEFAGNVEEANLEYLLRDFESAGIKEKLQRVNDVSKEMNEKYGYNCVEVELKHEYSNMGELIAAKEGIIENCVKACELEGVTPIVKPIRGGTDGSTLAEKGLPCPNIFMGGHNFHSVREFISVDAMKKSMDVIIRFLEIMK
ncbi:MAG: peptidase T [Anaerovoracaceae bacterium]